jgi:RHS repeat-associated protein
VLDLAGHPLAGVTLSLGQERARTDVTGRFLLALPDGATPAAGRIEPAELAVDGATASHLGRAYGRFQIRVALSPGQTTVLPYTIWLPALDLAHAISLPEGPLPAGLILTSPRAPGLEVHLPAGSRLVDHAGRPVKQVSLTPIPTDRPPFPLPPGVDPPVYFTLQPGGAYLAYPAGAGARIVYPNFDDVRRMPTGTRCAFWHYEPDREGWRVYGEGEVGPGGEQIFPDPGVAVYEFTGAMLSVNGMAPPALAPPAGGQAWAGDPVDLASGLFVLSTTDLHLPGLPALALTRTYRPEDPAVRPFGRGTTHNYALFLWSALPYQEADLVLPDGASVHYVRTSPGVGFGDAEFAHTGSPTPFSGSTLRWVEPTGGWDLTLRDGTVMHFGINAPLQWIRDRAGNTVTLHRPGGAQVGPITRVSGSSGRWLALTYDLAGRISRVQDSAGRAVAYAYDADHRLVAVTDPAGGVTRYTYDAAQRMLTLTDARGIAFLRNTYDGAGRVVSQTLADGGTHTFAYAVDAEGRVSESRVTDPAGSVRRVTLDASGYATSDTEAWGTPLARTTALERDPASHRITGVVDALGRRTALAYDASGNLTRLTFLEGTGSPVAWSVAYEPRFSRPASVTDPLGRAVTLDYDGRGNLIALTDPTGRTVTLAYGAEGLPVAVTTPAGTSRYAWEHGDLVEMTDPLGQRWTRAIDAAGRPTALTDPLGRTARLVWDPLGRLVERVDPAGGRTTFAHDPNGNLLEARNARGHAVSHGYDAMDRRATRTDPLGAVTRFRHDAAGRLVEVVDRTGAVTAITWDALHRPTSLVDGDGAVSTYTWDAGNRLVAVDDARSGSITRQHDLLDRLIEEASPAGALQYAYDPLGRRVRLAVAGQSPVEYDYDAAGRLTGLSQDGEAITVTLDAAGRPARLSRPTGLLTDIAWDPASRVTRLAWRHGGGLLGELTQAYDAVGRPVAQGGSWAATRLPAPLAAAVYDPADRPLALGARTLSWDAEGRLIEVDDPATGPVRYTWNARGQLIGHDSPSGRLAFRHDGVDRRAETVDGGLATEWLHDGLTPALERRQGAVHATRLAGPGLDEIWARTGPAGRRWPLTDMVGSPIAWVGDDGAVVTRAVYGPFGDAAITGEPQPTGFTGREQDRPDLLHFRARPYVPSLRRFVSEDPLEAPAGNLYAYADNAPLSGVDPLGLYTVIVHGGLPSLGPNGSWDQGGNYGLNNLADFLDWAGEPVGVYNSAQAGLASRAARAACLSGQPVHLIGHSLGGAAAIDIAWQLAARGIYVSDLTAIDAFRARHTSAPPGVLTYSFYQRQGMPRGRPLGGRKANPFDDQLISGLPGNPHLTITDHPRVATTMMRLALFHNVPCVVVR